GFLDPRGDGKKKKNTKQGNGSSCSLMADVKSFPPLHDHMVSSSGGEFVVEEGLLLQGITRMRDVTRKVTVGPDVAKNNVVSLTFTPNGSATKNGESWGRSSYRRILIEINARNEFSDYLAMVVLNLKGSGYAKETISIEYEWKPPHCLDIGADDEGFIEVEKNKSGGNNCGTKNFTVSVKSKTQYRPKEKQSSEGTIPPNTTPFVGTSKASTSCYNKESSSNKDNIFSLSNSFEALANENLIIGEVASGSVATTSGTQEEGHSSTPSR
ncbi:hypothetical protein Tco_0850602, partial [Tanacetum coccineum]